MKWWNRRGRSEPDTSDPDGPPAPRDAPQQAWIELDDGTRVSCSVVEDPDGTPEGLRLFVLWPEREWAPHEQAVSVHLDRLPARSKVVVEWPGCLHGDARGALSWRDSSGQAHHKSIEPGSLDDPEGGSGDVRIGRHPRWPDWRPD